MASGSRVTVTGLREFQTALRRMDRELPKTLRVGLNQIAELVVTKARPLVAKRSGRAAGSLRVGSSQREARVRAGGARARYYPWLDFGGRVGKQRQIYRQFIREGRYIYPTVERYRADIEKLAADVMIKVATDAGLEVN